MRGTATPPIHSWKCARIGWSVTTWHRLRKNSATVKPKATTSFTSPSPASHADAVVLPQQVLVGVDVREAGAVIQQDDARPAGDQPAAVVAGDALRAQLIERLADEPFGGLLLEFHGRGLRVVGADQAVAVAPALASWRRPWCAGRCRCRRAASRPPRRSRTAGASCRAPSISPVGGAGCLICTGRSNVVVRWP